MTLLILYEPTAFAVGCFCAVRRGGESFAPPGATYFALGGKVGKTPLGVAPQDPAFASPEASANLVGAVLTIPCAPTPLALLRRSTRLSAPPLGAPLRARFAAFKFYPTEAHGGTAHTRPIREGSAPAVGDDDGIVAIAPTRFQNRCNRCGGDTKGVSPLGHLWLLSGQTESNPRRSAELSFRRSDETLPRRRSDETFPAPGRETLLCRVTRGVFGAYPVIQALPRLNRNKGADLKWVIPSAAPRSARDLRS